MNYLICNTPSCDLEADPDLLEFGKQWARSRKGSRPFAVLTLMPRKTLRDPLVRSTTNSRFIRHGQAMPLIVYREWVRV